MEKIFLILMLLFYSTIISSNAQKPKDILKEIDGNYSVDENGNVTFIKIVEAPNLSSDEIFKRVLNYFTYNYSDANSVIQTKDKDAGIIVGKGVYKDIYTGSYQLFYYDKISTWHIIRVDIKEGRARIILSLTNYDEVISNGNSIPQIKHSKVSNEYPINLKGSEKNLMIRSFYKSYQAANSTLESFAKAIIDGNTSKSIENNNW